MRVGGWGWGAAGVAGGVLPEPDGCDCDGGRGVGGDVASGVLPEPDWGVWRDEGPKTSNLAERTPPYMLEFNTVVIGKNERLPHRSSSATFSAANTPAFFIARVQQPWSPLPGTSAILSMCRCECSLDRGGLCRR